jgi:hypothetical protein
MKKMEKNKLDNAFWEAPTKLQELKKAEKEKEPVSLEGSEPILFAEIRNGKITWKNF